MKQVDYIKKVNIYRNEMPLWLKTLLKTIFIIFLICCLFVAIFNFIYSYVEVYGSSMYPTLNGSLYDEYGNEIGHSVKDSVYINRAASYSRGDIVVFENPSNSESGKNAVKRLIATGGDQIAISAIPPFNGSEENSTYKIFLIKKGTNVIEVLTESYLPEGLSLYYTFRDFRTYRLKPENLSKFTTINDSTYGTLYFLKLKNSEVFLLGDNRNSDEYGRGSYDSADYGPVNSSKYIGRVDIIAYESKNNLHYIFAYFWSKLFG